jgi:hypothetical protein
VGDTGAHRARQGRGAAVGVRVFFSCFNYVKYVSPLEMS